MSCLGNLRVSRVTLGPPCQPWQRTLLLRRKVARECVRERKRERERERVREREREGESKTERERERERE